MPLPTLNIPSVDQPTFWNKHIFKGLTIGGLLAMGVATLMTSPIAIAWTGIACMAAGGIYTGLTGKKQMENDIRYGKEVKTPTFFNNDMFMGLFMGYMVPRVMFTLAKLYMENQFPGVHIMPLLGDWQPYVPVAAGLLEGFMGGLVGKRAMQREYNLAHAITAQSVEPAINLAPQRARSRGVAHFQASDYTATPEESALLESKLREHKEKTPHHFSQMEESRKLGHAHAHASADGQHTSL